MKQILAEELLAKVLNWTPADVAKERPLLQAMASLKYDEYEQYSPGMRFLESLALWLNQFQAHHRDGAYRFIKKHLIFCSSAEMNHLVETAYADHVRPFLLELSASEQSVKPWHVGPIAASADFRVLQRQSLFLGLSDGARIDTFRRANPELNHEQIWQTHELSKARVDELLAKLNDHVRVITGDTSRGNYRFRSIILLDDFSASGSSYYVAKPKGRSGGKVAKFLRSLESDISDLCDPSGVALVILIYVATEQAISHLQLSLATSERIKVVSVRTVQLLPKSLVIKRHGNEAINGLIDSYYDHSIFDVHMQKGGSEDGRYGYADCGLPIILHHNTPNNSVALLWFYETCNQLGLFPRVQRHREIP